MYTYEYIVRIVSFEGNEYIDESITILPDKDGVNKFLGETYNEYWRKKPHNNKWGHQDGWLYFGLDGYKRTEIVTILERVSYTKPIII